MKKARRAFFDDGQRLDADPDTRHLANCWLCKQRIDYSVGASTTPDSHNLDHYVTVDERPDLQEDPSNFRHSHFLCNGNRGNRTPSAGLGETVGEWW